MNQIKTATGATITATDLHKEKQFLITDFGAKQEISGEESHCLENTAAINHAIEEANLAGGGTVVVPKGEYKVYTILLKSNVNICLSEGSLLRAARTDIEHSYEKQVGEGGNYAEPEVNLYAGLQDHGHSYFANSMFYGVDLENIMIFGKGTIDGSCYDEEGYRQYVLMGGDPFDQPDRTKKGHVGEWFGNKCMALVRCKNIVLKDFSLVIGGHFAIIAEGVINLLIEDILVDTTRDALDIDCCQDVTVRNSHFNSLTDDGLVMKASYGAGTFMPTQNVLIEDCKVSGYDAGSVYAGKYTRDKLIATDRCGPTGRVKFGTESTCGYHQVTIRRVQFDRSRGFAMEAVDGSDLSDVIFTDCTMEDVSSSPIFIKVGDRGRFPVTGMQKSDEVIAKEPNVRLDNRNWVLPDRESYQLYPVKRYTPSYNKNKKVTVDGHTYFTVVDPKDPVRINYANFKEKDGAYYPLTYVQGEGYVPDETAKPIESERLACYANGNGSEHLAGVYNIEISNVTIKNADPRYPILLMGLTDSKIKNVVLRNIRAEFRGGLKMEHAVEQRQLNTNWEYSQFETKASVQTLPWLVNTFFLKEEGLLPRADWDKDGNAWKDDPYNVPELPGVYPEPSNWGILPAYGFYARHIENLTIDGLELSWKVEDGRHALVLDDAANVELRDIKASVAKGQSMAAFVTNCYKRHTNEEYVPDLPYFMTTVSDVTVPQDMEVALVKVEAPAPGTPADSLYSYPTLPIPENGYRYAVATEDYPLPKTVFRPFFQMEKVYESRVAQEAKIQVIFRNPAFESSSMQASGMIYNERSGSSDFVVDTQPQSIEWKCMGLPENAIFDEETKCITFIPKEGQEGTYMVTLQADDGLIPETVQFEWRILAG